MTKKYRVSSVADLWDPYEVEVGKDGYVISISDRNDILVGSKFESLKSYWSKFEGENAYKVEEVNG